MSPPEGRLGETARHTPEPPLRQSAEPPRWRFRDLTIRRYRDADHEVVLDLHRETLAQVGLVPGDGVYYDHDLFQIQEIYFRAGGEFLVGERAGRLVAMGGLRRAELVPSGVTRAHGGWALPGVVPEDGGPPLPERPGTAELVRLRVRADLQRRGYGAAMEEALETRAAELGYRRLVCDTTERQEAAIALYRAFGWTETGREVIGGIVNIYFTKILR